MRSYKQAPDAHVYYDVDWADWLTARSLDENDIESVTWTASGDLEITDTILQTTLSRVYVRGTTVGKKYLVTSHITVLNHDGGDSLHDDYSFEVVGAVT